MDYQKIILLGNTTADVEVKKAERGTEYARFSVGIGKGKDESIFFPVTVFGKSAKTAGEILAKGDRVLVEGRLDVDQESGRFSVVARTFCKA
jgi:single-strand DNA-binding protein